MKVSLIVPAYNEEKFIGKLLDSLLLQSLLPDEIIICDNGSNDRTVDVINTYSHRLPIKLVRQPLKGIARALQTAFEASSGDLILRTDADTILPKNWIKNITSHYMSDSNLDVVFGSYYGFDGPLFHRLIMRLAVPLSLLYFPLFRGFTFIPGANFSIRRQSLLKIDGWNPLDSTIPEDQLMSQKISKYRLKFHRFSDCKNYTSTRRFVADPREFLYSLLSVSVDPRFYREKSI